MEKLCSGSKTEAHHEAGNLLLQTAGHDSTEAQRLTSEDNRQEALGECMSNIESKSPYYK